MTFSATQPHNQYRDWCLVSLPAPNYSRHDAATRPGETALEQEAFKEEIPNHIGVQFDAARVKKCVDEDKRNFRKRISTEVSKQSAVVCTESRIHEWHDEDSRSNAGIYEEASRTIDDRVIEGGRINEDTKKMPTEAMNINGDMMMKGSGSNERTYSYRKD